MIEEREEWGESFVFCSGSSSSCDDVQVTEEGRELNFRRKLAQREPLELTRFFSKPPAREADEEEKEEAEFLDCILRYPRRRGRRRRRRRR